MVCRISDLRYKDVINLQDGSCLGSVCDVELDCEKAKVRALVVRSRMRFFFFSRGEEWVIDFHEVKVIGEDAILVCFDRNREKKNEKKTGFSDEKEIY
ncbi:MAG: YlmC/YmxH family sporulation protein [Oscillospiraceae bacterium]|nr:YlmC/YmxH family sporulation protein [Oscillospiraceae bacterium]MBQ3241318.1 YlmC/YmxH family sporulation protein [Oscillospiraceae bacterium]MBQ7082114.1 YlmC/YmxH family sporulation protein [Oscillospiraceae bacterium]MBR2636916.1 YlmC/YmxH family sporulation protein [Oscillospiraceae bacterium]